ncbi:uncharacterized protein LOC133410076 [Phycodurus eques]|uniref:uncharacterized protein LOC133410076 n=1 Tax=Phycodurus eques TaxID=693459 RepID=UPI002ACF07C6|nr:uncharacterized protein LOC133410076 [Phycodurus eques]
MRVCNGRQEVCQRDSAMMRPNEGRQAHSAADGLTLSGPGNRTVQIAEGDVKSRFVIDVSIIQTSPPPSYRTCIRREVPPRCTSSIVFLDKLFSASLAAPDWRGAAQNVRYKSTLFVRLSLLCASTTKEGSRGPKATVLGGEQHDGGESWGHQHQDGKRWGQRGKAASKGTQARTEVPRKCPAQLTREREMDYCHLYLKTNTLEATSKSLSLQEALELFRPDFISRSQGRVRRMEQARKRRRGMKKSSNAVRDGGVRGRRCTTPDPLSDNLFKPRARSISGREMLQRSRSMYNKLPEVAKKKQEAEKRAVSQANRLRAALFKKKLLDQILQR